MLHNFATSCKGITLGFGGEVGSPQGQSIQLCIGICLHVLSHCVAHLFIALSVRRLLTHLFTHVFWGRRAGRNLLIPPSPVFSRGPEARQIQLRLLHTSKPHPAPVVSTDPCLVNRPSPPKQIDSYGFVADFLPIGNSSKIRPLQNPTNISLTQTSQEL